MPDFGSLVRRALILCAFPLLAFTGGKAAAEDAYLLALSWQPAFCATHAATEECQAQDKPRLVLHGLWPDWDADGDGHAGGDFCLPGENNRQAIRALDSGGSWLKLPVVKLSSASSNDLEGVMPGVAAGLERHEWWKHGTCSGLAAEDYFATAIALTREVERGALARLITAKAGGTVARKDLLAAFEQDFGPKTARALGLDCDRSGATLNEIRIRLKRESIAQGLTPESLAVPQKAPRGDCAAQIHIPDLRS